MPSWQSRLLNTLLRNRHLLKFRLKQEAWDWNTSVEDFRRDCENSARKAGSLPQGIEAIPVSIEGLPAVLSAEWIRPVEIDENRTNATPIVFYTHGGGYISGSCNDHRVHVAKIVKGSGIAALLFEYRLAPEYSFPAALDDTITAYRWLLAQGYSAQHIVIAGESAGGGLCLAALLAFREKGLPMPAAGVSLSPWTDLTCSSESYRTKARVCLSPPGMSKVCSRYYAGDNDLTHPWISPLFSDLEGLPPLLIMVGDDETLRDDSIRFAEKAKAAGVDVRLRVEEGMVHCYPFFAPLIPEATAAMQEICDFINLHAGTRSLHS